MDRTKKTVIAALLGVGNIGLPLPETDQIARVIKSLRDRPTTPMKGLNQAVLNFAGPYIETDEHEDIFVAEARGFLKNLRTEEPAKDYWPDVFKRYEEAEAQLQTPPDELMSDGPGPTILRREDLPLKPEAGIPSSDQSARYQYEVSHLPDLIRSDEQLRSYLNNMAQRGWRFTAQIGMDTMIFEREVQRPAVQITRENITLPDQEQSEPPEPPGPTDEGLSDEEWFERYGAKKEPEQEK